MDYSYYVKTNGDTLQLGEKDVINLHSHPQLYFVYDAAGHKTVLQPDSVVFMRQFTYYYGKPPRYVNYELYDIPAASGSCRHYMNRVYAGAKTFIYESPYCQECQSMKYFIVANGKCLETMTRKNFQELIDKYFSDDAVLRPFTAKKRYWGKLCWYLYGRGTMPLKN